MHKHMLELFGIINNPSTHYTMFLFFTCGQCPEDMLSAKGRSLFAEFLPDPTPPSGAPKMSRALTIEEFEQGVEDDEDDKAQKEAYALLKLGVSMTDVGETPVCMTTGTAGTLLYIGGIQGLLMSWSIQNNRRYARAALLVKEDKTALSCMDVVDGLHVAAGTHSGRLALMDLKTGDRKAYWDDHQARVAAVAIPTGSSLLYSCGVDGEFQARNLEQDTIQHRFCSCRCPLTAMQYTPTNINEVALGCVDGSLRWLDLRARSVVQEWQADPTDADPIRSLGLSPTDPALLYVAFGRGHLQAWDRRMMGGEGSKPLWQVRSVHRDAIPYMCVAPDRIYTCGDEQSIKILKSSDGGTLETLDGVRPINGVQCMAMVNGELLAGGMNRVSFSTISLQCV
jgi:hypothetical protein